MQYPPRPNLKQKQEETIWFVCHESIAVFSTKWCCRTTRAAGFALPGSTLKRRQNSETLAFHFKTKTPHSSKYNTTDTWHIKLTYT